MASPDRAMSVASTAEATKTATVNAAPTPDALEKAEPTAKSSHDDYEMPFYKIVVIMATVILAMFLMALDRTIIGVAIPRITDQFHSVADIGWYGSAFLVTQAGSQLLFGRVYKHQSAKYTFLTCVALFEIGSALCGAAPNSNALIVGRAIAGLGAGGITSGGTQIMISVVPLNKRAGWMALFGFVFGGGAAIAPLLGGVLTSHVSWRWCFYINLPIGGLSLAVILLVLNLDADKEKRGKRISLKEQFLQLDPVGALFMFGWVITLVLALQWGNFTYPWSDARIIVLFTIFAITFIAFVAWQWYVGSEAMIPLAQFKQRTFSAASFWSAMSYGGMTSMIYYLPTWFQVIKGSDALHSSYQTLPFILSLVIGSMSFGAIVRKTGHYMPSVLVSAIVAPIGAGLISTFDLNTGHARWIGYQVIYGFGVGHGMMGANMAVQGTFQDDDIPVAMANVFFFQLLGAAVWVAVAQNLFAGRLIEAVKGVPGIDPKTFGNIGATEVRAVFAHDPVALQGAIAAYNSALKNVWYLATGLTASLIIAAVFTKWVNLNKEAERRKQAKLAAAAEKDKAEAEPTPSA